MVHKKNKILFIIFQTGNRSNGGVESISQVLCHLKDWDRYILTNRETSKNKSWKESGAHVSVAPSRSIPLVSTIVNSLVLSGLSWWLIRKHKIRVVHCNDIQSISRSFLGVALAKSKVVFNIRDVKAPGDQYGFKWKMAKRLSDFILVLSKEMKSQLVSRLSVHNSKIIDYQYSIVNFQKFAPLPSQDQNLLKTKFGISDQSPVLGIVAAFMPKKQQLPFITHTIPELTKQLPGVQICFLGDFDTEINEYAKKCYQASLELNVLDNIRFLDYQPNIAEWLNVFDITVVASEREGLARCMIESISCGTPVVSFSVCSAKEILEEHNCGIVVPEDDYSALTKALIQLSSDKQNRHRLGENGFKVSRKLFDEQHILKYYSDMYSKLVQL